MTHDDDIFKDPIKRAMDEGKFDNLPGHGKPLKWDDNPFADPDMEVAHRLLRDNGFTLPWLEERKEIEELIANDRKTLRRQWSWNQHTPGDGWQRALENFHERVEQINQRIRDYNLATPGLEFHIRLLDYEREIARARREAEDSA
jgi:DnaJ family protein C protein 28